MAEFTVSRQRPRQGRWPGSLCEGLSVEPTWLLPDSETQTITDATSRAGECPSTWDSNPQPIPISLPTVHCELIFFIKPVIILQLA